MTRVTTVLASCCLAVALVTSGVGELRAQTRPLPGDLKRLIGAWRLVSFELSPPNDQENLRWRRAHPSGLIFYDATGHMAAQMMPDRQRRRFTGPPSAVFAGPQPTAEEALDAMFGYVAYFGTYWVDQAAHTVTHHRAGNLDPGALGDFVRRYDFAGEDRLVLTPLDSPTLRTGRVTLERLK